MKEGIAALLPHVNQWMDVGEITEVDWSRVRVLEFQDLLRSRNSLAKHLGDKECLKCPEIAKHVRVSSS
jgi:antiviral helicase SKI2